MLRVLLTYSLEYKEYRTWVTMVNVMANFTSGLKKVMVNLYTQDQVRLQLFKDDLYTQDQVRLYLFKDDLYTQDQVRLYLFKDDLYTQDQVRLQLFKDDFGLSKEESSGEEGEGTCTYLGSEVDPDAAVALRTLLPLAV